MKLWHLSQTRFDGYDTYSDCVVAAETEELARRIHPDPSGVFASREWPGPEFVMVELIGDAAENVSAGVICSSFHAG